MYRDDLAAATARRDALDQERARLQTRLADHAAVQQRVRELDAELADVTRQIEQSRKRLPMLNRIGVSTPCKEPWARMQGDDKIRFCGRCEKNVYNLSAMTTEEAEALVSSRADMCVRLFRRPDGTVLTSDCPVGARKRRRRRLVVAAVAAVGAAAGVAWMLQDRGEEPPAVQGALAAPEITEPVMELMGEVEAGGISYDDDHSVKGEMVLPEEPGR